MGQLIVKELNKLLLNVKRSQDVQFGFLIALILEAGFTPQTDTQHIKDLTGKRLLLTSRKENTVQRMDLNGC